MSLMYEKWEICNIVLEEIIDVTKTILKSICYGYMCSLNVDDMWGLFKFLAHNNGNVSLLVSLLCAFSHLPMVCTLNIYV